MDKEQEIGALWKRQTRAGKLMLSGKINGEDVVIFENGYKEGKKPDYIVYRSQPRE